MCGLLLQIHPTINWISEKSIVSTCKMFTLGDDFLTTSLPRVPSRVIFSLYFGLPVANTMGSAFLYHVVRERDLVC